MPSFITHHLFGKDLAILLEGRAADLIKQHPIPYYWGLQGPDIFFFHRFFSGKRSPLPQYGTLLHTQKTDQLFQVMAQEISAYSGRLEFDELLAYYIGFIGHYCLDCSTHPYIYGKQMEMQKQLPPKHWRGLHHRIESDIDSSLYRLKEHRLVNTFPVKLSYRIDDRFSLSLAMVYHKVLGALYGLNIKPEELRRTLGDSVRAFALEVEPTGFLFRSVTRAAEKVSGQGELLSAFLKKPVASFSILNREHHGWSSADKPELRRFDSFLDLYYSALFEAKQMALAAVKAVTQGKEFVPKGLPPFDAGSLRK